VTRTIAALEPWISDEVVAGDAGAVVALQDAVGALVARGTAAQIRVFAANGPVFADSAAGGGTPAQQPDAEADARDAQTVSELAMVEGPATIEVYSVVSTQTGTPLLVEAKYPYSLFARDIDDAANKIGRLMVAGLLLCLPPLVVLALMIQRSMRHRAERERLLERLIGASDAERRLIAGSVHDGPVQDLMGVAMQLQGVSAVAEGPLGPRLQAIAADVRTTVRALRSLLNSVYPVGVPEAGWVAGLEETIEALRAAGTEVTLDVPDWPMTRTEQWLLLRVSREALRNVHAHAGAEHVWLVVDPHPNQLILTITDDGVGFDCAGRRAAGHLGLPLLHDRAEELGATLVVEPAPGRSSGTAVRLAMRRTA
jgi:signal transduction histidine kinase